MNEAKNRVSGFVDVSGARLYYEMAGSGEPVVLLHGGMLDRRMWDGQFEFLAQRYRVVRYDDRYCGKTEATLDAGDYVSYQDLYQILQALDIEKATLIGLSLGARVSIDFAIAYPERVRKLIAISPGLSGYDFVDSWAQERWGAMMQAVERQDQSAAVEIFLTMWVDGPKRTPAQIDPEVRERLSEMAANSSTKDDENAEFKELEPPAVGRLSEIKAPTLIVLGEKDTSDIFTISTLLHEQIAGSKLVMIPDVAHTLVMEKPGELNTLVAQFLEA